MHTQIPTCKTARKLPRQL